MEKFTIGTPVRQVITARNMNEIADAVNRVHSFSNDPGYHAAIPDNYDIVRVKTSSSFPKFAVVALSANLITDPVNSNDLIPTLQASQFSESTPDDNPVAILQTPANAGEYARAMISGVSFARIVINDETHKYAKPQASSDFPGLLESAASGPIRILAVSPRKLDGYTVAAVLLGSSGTQHTAYSGPWSLYVGSTNQIHMRPGILWTPDGAEWVQPNYIPKPSAASFIVFDDDSGARIVPMTDDGSLGSFTRQNPRYWDTHAIIGRYDPATDTLEQYHFSPVVFFIETEDFVIEPE